MKLTKKQKRYLRENFYRNSNESLSKKLGISEGNIHSALKQLNLKRTDLQVKALRDAEAENKMPAKKGSEPGQKFFFRKPVVFLFAGVLIIAIVIYFSFSKSLFTRKPAYSSEIKKMMGSLDESELNILFITLDTLRADHLGCYGYDNVETPNIDRLAETGILFKNAVSQAPLTLPSHSSIFTGTYPSYHGVRDNGGFYLEAEQTTLAELLKERGWATSAFIGAFVLDSRWGLNQGFDFYFDDFDLSKYKVVSLDSVQRDGGKVTEAFFNWLDKNPQKNFFSWIHLYDPHTPYDPPEPFKTKYSHYTWGLYDGEIAYVDVLIGQIMDRLQEKNIQDNTLIVIVGDHGECLGEHAEYTHGFFVYDAAIMVPLIIHIPSSSLSGKQVLEIVETVDIMPTLLQLLGLSIPKEVQGKSLVPLIAGDRIREERFAYSETYFPRYRYGWSPLKCLRGPQYKYIQAPKPELYDFINDPGELNNIYHQDPRRSRLFVEKLKELQEERSVEGIEERVPQRLDDESIEKLKALGYIGGFTSQAKLSQTENLPDPKDKIHLYNKIKMAEGASVAGNKEKALEEISKVIEEDPKIMEARQVRAQIFTSLNKFEEAIEDCQEALKIDPEYSAAIFSLAHAYKNLKKYDEAIAGYERLIQLDSRDFKPVLNLGDLYLIIKEFDKAIPLLQQSITMEPEQSAMGHKLLGMAFLEKKQWERAESELRKSLEMKPKIGDAHYNLALLYEERGEFEKAKEEYKKEIDLHPAAYPAHFNLAKLYGKMGDIDRQVEHFKAAIKYNEYFANAYLFLAKAYLDSGKNYDEALNLAEKGLELAPESEYAPLAHYILADIYNRKGLKAKYQEELRKAQLLRQKMESKIQK